MGSTKNVVGSISAGRGSVLSDSHQLGADTWAVLISGFANSGQARQALEIYEEMRQDGVEAKPHTLVDLLKACTCLLDLKRAKRIHADVVRSGLETDLYVGTMLVNTYAKCGSVENARRVFEEMPHRDVVSWNAMITGYSQMGKGEEALNLYTRMQQEGVVPTDRTYVGALKACSSIVESREENGGDLTLVRERCLDTVRAIHGAVQKGRYESNVFVGNMLVDAYCKCGSLEDAERVFEGMPAHSVVSWTALMFGYAQTEQGEEALKLYRRMREEGVVPDDRAYVSALKACSSIAELWESNGNDGLSRRQHLETVRSIHSDIRRGKLELDVFVGNMLVDAYAKCGSLQDARQVFEKMPHRDVVSWNALILGYSQADEAEKAEEALQLYTRMRQEGASPNNRTYVGALKACIVIGGSGNGIVKEKCMETVTAIHADLGNEKSDLDKFVGAMLVDAYAKCGSLANARLVFDKIPHRDVVVWTAMILGCAQMEKGEEALQLFNQMQKEAVIPNERTYLGALMACSSIAERENTEGNAETLLKQNCFRTVKAIHTDVERAGLESNRFLGNMLVDAYSKCGSLQDARRVFESMPQRDVVSWNSMIIGCAQMEKGDEALQLFAKMKQEGVVPNDRTYVGALNACGSVAALEKGKEIHAQILNAGLDAGSFMCNSLIDMYGKCSSMEVARQLFELMLVKDIVAWNSLIGGYARQGESEAVFELFDRMRQEGVQPNEITFVGVLIVCSHVGLVDRGQQYFEAMSKEFGLTPTIQHYNCMVDLLGRAGQVCKAMETVMTMPVQCDSAVWKCVLGACQKWANVELGRQAFEYATRLNASDAAPYLLMSNIYAAAHMPEEARKVRAMRVNSQARKEPGRSWWMDMCGNAHVFVVGDQISPNQPKPVCPIGTTSVENEQEHIPVGKFSLCCRRRRSRVTYLHCHIRSITDLSLSKGGIPYSRLPVRYLCSGIPNVFHSFSVGPCHRCVPGFLFLRKQSVGLEIRLTPTNSIGP